MSLPPYLSSYSRKDGNRLTLAELNCTQLQTLHGGTGWFVWNPCDLRVDNGQRLPVAQSSGWPEEVGDDTLLFTETLPG